MSTDTNRRVVIFSVVASPEEVSQLNRILPPEAQAVGVRVAEAGAEEWLNWGRGGGFLLPP